MGRCHMLKSITILFALLVAMAPLAQAKDVSAQQVGVEYARGNLEQADKVHKASLEQLAESEKRLAEAQQRLTEDKLKEADSKKKLDEANARFIKAQQLLDKAWKE